MLGDGTRLLLDSSVWIAILRSSDTSQVQRARNLFEGFNVLVADLVYVEVMRGASDAAQARGLAKSFADFEFVTLCSETIARRAVENHNLLRAKGATIRGTVDLIIGTWCIENHVSLAHQDKDFAHMERHLGLSIWRNQDV